MYTYEHPRPSVSVDVAIFRPNGEDFQLLLIERAQAPYKGIFALPGGFINIDESLEEAARRELFEETGIENLPLTQIHTFSEPDRDPRGRVISTCFGCVLDIGIKITTRPGDDAADAKWFESTDLPQLAFDHSSLIQAAIAKLLPSY